MTLTSLARLALAGAFLAIPLQAVAQPHPPMDVSEAAERLLAEEAPLSDVSLDTFVERLDAHGDWLDSEAHGRVWRPHIDQADWRPFSNGRWLHLDGLGWYWRSNEPWGWATDHYGRWVHEPDHGWLWRPDFEWAPAWVLWVETEDMIGWAALPPLELEGDPGPDAWVFVAREDFVSENLSDLVEDTADNRDHLLQARAFGAVTVEDGIASNTFVDPSQFGSEARIDEEEAGALLAGRSSAPEAGTAPRALKQKETARHYQPPLAPPDAEEAAGDVITGTVSAEAAASGGASAQGGVTALAQRPDRGAEARREAWEARLHNWDEAVDGPFPRPEWR